MASLESCSCRRLKHQAGRRLLPLNPIRRLPHQPIGSCSCLRFTVPASVPPVLPGTPPHQHSPRRPIRRLLLLTTALLNRTAPPSMLGPHGRQVEASPQSFHSCAPAARPWMLLSSSCRPLSGMDARVKSPSLHKGLSPIEPSRTPPFSSLSFFSPLFNCSFLFLVKHHSFCLASLLPDRAAFHSLFQPLHSLLRNRLSLLSFQQHIAAAQ